MALHLLAAICAAALMFGLWQDARDLTLLGRSLRERDTALEGTVLHSLGGVLEHRGFRARVHAGVTVILIGSAVLLTVQRRRPSEQQAGNVAAS